MNVQTAPEVLSPESVPAKEIEKLVQEGKRLLENGDLDTALELFEKVVAQYPERPEGYNNLGALFTSLGRFAKAEDCFGQILSILPDNCNVHYNRGIVRIRLQKFDDAIADFNVALAVQPDDADCWNNLGVATFLKQDFSDARTHFQKALELVPDFPNALLNLSDTELATGNRESAVAVCEDYLAQYTSHEVRQKLLELLVTATQEHIARACATAVNLLASDAEDEQTQCCHTCLTQAAAILAEVPTCRDPE
jgi:Flp pilus assembly protein TadD